MKQLLLILLGVMVICFSSCEEESIPPTRQELDTDFYPLEVGNTWIYQTDSVIFNKQLNSVDTLSGYVKESIVDEFIASEDVLTYVIERSFRRLETEDWKLTDTYSSSIIDNKVTRNEENLRFVKMVFPTTLDQQWDGNQFFDDLVIVNVGGELVEVYKDWESEVTGIDSTVIVNGIQYEDCIIITLADAENSIEKRYVQEVYSKNIGLISKQMTIILTQQTDTSIDIIDRAEKGFTLNQSLLEFSK